MHGRLRALALMVGLSALPLQASPTHANVCEIVGTNGSLIVNSGSSTNRSWRIFIEGVTYQSDTFDKLTVEKRSKKSTSKKSSNKKKKSSSSKENVVVFKDSSGITRTPNNDVVKTVDATIKGEINETAASGFVVIKDRTNNRDYRIEDPSQGTALSCT